MKEKLKFFLIFLFLQDILNSQTPTNLLIGETQKIKMIDTCEAYKFDTNYKQLNLKFFNITNVAKILITDKYFTDCSENSLLKCGVDSNLCQSYDITQKTLNSNFSIDFSLKMCINSVIVYMLKADVIITNNSTNITNNNSTNSTGNSTIHKTPHFFVSSQYYNEHCGYSHQSAIGYCGESSIEDCKKCNWRGCSLIECGSEVSKRFVKKYDLCLPNSLTDNEKLNYCQNFADVTDFANTSNCEDNSLEGYSVITVFIIGIIVIGVLVLSITVIYYNIYLVKYKAAPFKAPDFCPEFLFPRDNFREENETDKNLKEVFSETQMKNFNLSDK